MALSRSIPAIFAELEGHLLRNTNSRGPLHKLAKPGDLERACRQLKGTFFDVDALSGKSSDSGKTKSSPESPKTKEPHLLILTGFPCIKESQGGESGAGIGKKLLQETDGIAGAVAVARAVGLERSTIAIEGNCAEVVRACVGAVSVNSEGGKNLAQNENADIDNDNVNILELPVSRNSGTESEAETSTENPEKEDLQKIQSWISSHQPYTLLCIERAGFSSSSRCYTMSGRDITAKCAPESGVIQELWGNAATSKSRDDLDKDISDKNDGIIAIGDGGNELGLGSVQHLTREHINLGEKIACSERYSADKTIVCGVSNWGGYAVALGLQTLLAENKSEKPSQRQSQKSQSESTSRLSNRHSESQIAETLSKLEICDGITGEFAPASVDGMPMQQHLDVLREMYRICGLEGFDLEGDNLVRAEAG